MRYLTIHGLATRGESMQGLERTLDSFGRDARNISYGWTHLLTVWRVSAATAFSVADLIEPDDILIGHSNGCNVIDQIIRLGVRFAQAVYLGAALDRDTDVPESARVNRIHVFHTPSDRAVRAARWLPLCPWGDMGAVGYVGPQTIYRNHERAEIDGHSGWFDDLPWLANEIITVTGAPTDEAG